MRRPTRHRIGCEVHGEVAWVCLRAQDGFMVVSVAGEAGVPLRLVSADERPAISVLDQKALNPYFHDILKPLLDPARNRDAVMPGAATEYRLKAAEFENANWEFQPYPAMFLLNYLSTTVAFMKCMATTLDISQAMDVVLGAVNAAPAMVAGNAADLWNAQQHRNNVTVALKGELQWSTYSGTVNDARISFDHPASWTVMDGSVNQQFASRTAWWCTTTAATGWPY
ncbi:hypothetical protein AAGW05_01855 [Arthrobacter sp. LAPM80]|uniref:hypothetical protein n=1 Tax=Arthrobacter sp. LAPM80 TaxID=3141788 RepID=UPI00398A72B7